MDGLIPKGMKPGRRELASASLVVSISTAVPEAMRAGTREISHVFVPPEDRGKRLATALMNFICQEADANRITLLLTVRPYGESGPDEDRLKAWYEKFGFAELQDSPLGALMARRIHVPGNIIPLAVHRALH
jgi:GNAT superfamily N-acetyltransferase